MRGTRVPDCTCKSPGISPFFQVRWKRLVVDEGHVSSSLSTTLIQLIRLLSVERRWIVTGTPTTNLLGLSFGSTPAKEDGEAMDIDIDDDEYLTNHAYDTPRKISSSDPSESSRSRSGSLPPSMTRIWNKYDREDLHKLGNMITHFVAVPHFSADVKLMYNKVTAPLLDSNGPRSGAIQVLTQVMQMVMVRHR